MSIGKLSYHHFPAYFDTPCIVFDKVDRMGRPVIVLYPRNFPLSGTTTAAQSSIGSLTCLLMEVTRQYMHDLSQLHQESKHITNLISQCIILVDMSEAPFIPVNAELINYIRDILDKRFPGSIKAVHVLNFALAYQGLWQMVKFLLSDDLKHIIRFNSENELQKIMAEEDLERILGSIGSNPWVEKSEEVWKKYGYHPDIVPPKKKSRISIRDLFPEPPSSLNHIPDSLPDITNRSPRTEDITEKSGEPKENAIINEPRKDTDLDNDQTLEGLDAENNSSIISLTSNRLLVSQNINTNSDSETYTAAPGQEDQSKSLIRLTGAQNNDLGALQKLELERQPLNTYNEILEKHPYQKLASTCTYAQNTTLSKVNQYKEDSVGDSDRLDLVKVKGQSLDQVLEFTDTSINIETCITDETIVIQLIEEDISDTETYIESDLHNTRTSEILLNDSDMLVKNNSSLLYEDSTPSNEIDDVELSMLSEVTYNDETSFVELLLDSDSVKSVNESITLPSKPYVTDNNIKTKSSSLDSPDQNYNSVVCPSPTITYEAIEGFNSTPALAYQQSNTLRTNEFDEPLKHTVTEHIDSCDSDSDTHKINISPLNITTTEFPAIAKHDSTQTNSLEVDLGQTENVWNIIPDFSKAREAQKSLQENLVEILARIEDLDSPNQIECMGTYVTNEDRLTEHIINICSDEYEEYTTPILPTKKYDTNVEEYDDIFNKSLVLFDEKNHKIHENSIDSSPCVDQRDESNVAEYLDYIPSKDIMATIASVNSETLSIFADENELSRLVNGAYENVIEEKTLVCNIFPEKPSIIEIMDSFNDTPAVKALTDMIASIDDMLTGNDDTKDTPCNISSDTSAIFKDRKLSTLEPIEEEEAEVNKENDETLETEDLSNVGTDIKYHPTMSKSIIKKRPVDKTALPNEIKPFVPEVNNGGMLRIEDSTNCVSDTISSKTSDDSLSLVYKTHKEESLAAGSEICALIESDCKGLEKCSKYVSSYGELAVALSNVSNFLDLFTEDGFDKNDYTTPKKFYNRVDLIQNNEGDLINSSKTKPYDYSKSLDLETYDNEIETLLNITYDSPYIINKRKDIYGDYMCSSTYADKTAELNNSTYTSPRSEKEEYYTYSNYTDEITLMMKISYEVTRSTKEEKITRSECFDYNTYTKEILAMANISYEAPKVKNEGITCFKDLDSISYAEEAATMMNIKFNVSSSVKNETYGYSISPYSNILADEIKTMMNITYDLPLLVKEQTILPGSPGLDTFIAEVGVMMKIEYDIPYSAKKKCFPYPTFADTNMYEDEVVLLMNISYDNPESSEANRAIPSSRHVSRNCADEIDIKMKIMSYIQSQTAEGINSMDNDSITTYEDEKDFLLAITSNTILLDKATQTLADSAELNINKEEIYFETTPTHGTEITNKESTPDKTMNFNLNSYTDEVPILQSIQYDSSTFDEHIITVNSKDMEPDFDSESKDICENTNNYTNTSKALVTDILSVSYIKSCSEATPNTVTLKSTVELDNKIVGTSQNHNEKSRIEELFKTNTICEEKYKENDTTKMVTMNDPGVGDVNIGENNACEANVSEENYSERYGLSTRSVLEEKLEASIICVNARLDSGSKETTREPSAPATGIYDQRMSFMKSFLVPENGVLLSPSDTQERLESHSSASSVSKKKSTSQRPDLFNTTHVVTEVDCPSGVRLSGDMLRIKDSRKEPVSVRQDILPINLLTGPLPLPSPQPSPRMTFTRALLNTSGTTSVAIAMPLTHISNRTSDYAAITEVDMSTSSHSDSSNPNICGPLWPIVRTPMPFTTWLGIYTGITVYKSFIHTHYKTKETLKDCKCLQRASSRNKNIHQVANSDPRFQSRSLPTRLRRASFFQTRLPTMFIWPYGSTVLDVTKRIVRATYPRYSLVYWIMLYICIRGPVEFGLSRLISQSVESPKRVATITLSIAATITAITSSSLAYFANP
ncbi:hypothetical protein F4703DRAFT_1839393 [Phycomyces blakesleeanus]